MTVSEGPHVSVDVFVEEEAELMELHSPHRDWLSRTSVVVRQQSEGRTYHPTPQSESKDPQTLSLLQHLP